MLRLDRARRRAWRLSVLKTHPWREDLHRVAVGPIALFGDGHNRCLASSFEYSGATVLTSDAS